jgi:hypothetical protein
MPTILVLLMVFLFLNFLLLYNNITINPIIKDGKLMSIDVKFNKIKIKFKDSLLLLPLSLKTLSNTFSVQQKELFPYSFVNNPKIGLDYIGKIPSIKYFDNISTSQEYDNYCNNFQNKNN